MPTGRRGAKKCLTTRMKSRRALSLRMTAFTPALDRAALSNGIVRSTISKLARVLVSRASAFLAVDPQKDTSPGRAWLIGAGRLIIAFVTGRSHCNEFSSPRNCPILLIVIILCSLCCPLTLPQLSSLNWMHPLFINRRMKSC